MSVWDLFKRKKKKPEKVDPAANLNQETEEKPAAEKADLKHRKRLNVKHARRPNMKRVKKAEREARRKSRT